MDEDKIKKRIGQIQQRIYDLTDKIDASMSTSEIKKIDKVKSKLYKEKNKLMNKLYPKTETVEEDDGSI